MTRRFHEWVFSDDMSGARSDDGTQARFTRQERLLLARLIAARNRVLSRDSLLDCLPRPDRGDDVGERHVDYLINRLRRRLGDTAREPRFIATHYGEGYCWIAPPAAPPADAFVLILPLHATLPPALDTFMQALCHGLCARIVNPPGTIAASVAPGGWRPDADSRAAYLLELSASIYEDTLHLAAVLREPRSGQVVFPMRLSRPQQDYGHLDAGRDGEQLAEAMHQHIWAHRALAPATDAPAEPPLELRLHEATCLFGDPAASWQQSLQRLDGQGGLEAQQVLADMTRAMVLLTRIAQQSFHVPCLEEPEWDALETQIEALVLPHLDAIAGQPLLELAASRLLTATAGRHFDIAFALARSGFQGTTAFATAFVTLAQCHVFVGDFELADELYERAVELAEPGSEFLVYLRVLQCIAHTGSGNGAALAHCREQLYAAKPSTRLELGLWFEDADAGLAPDLAGMLAMVAPADLSRVLTMSERKVRNFFRDRRHRDSCLRGLVGHVARHVGEAAVPGCLRPLLPVTAG